MKLFHLLLVSTSLILINADEFVHTLTSKNFDTFISEHSYVLVTFYAPWCAHSRPLLPEFKKAAETLSLHKYNDVVLAKVDVMIEKDLATKYQIKAYPTLKFFAGDVSNPIDYYDGRTEETIIKWILTQISVQGPLIQRYREDVDYDLPLVWISFDGAQQNEKQSIISNLMPFARDTQDKLSFVWFDNREISDRRLQKLGITQTPGILIESDKKKWFRVYSNPYNEKYLFDGNIFDTNQLKEFFTSYDAGKLTPYIQSQPIPETNNETVYILVGSTFQDVIGKEKDVFVFFYASWHGHSKQFAPEYEKVGEAFKDSDSIIIAKINAAENDTPQPVQGLPMLFFYPSQTGSTNGIRYESIREHKSVIKWIKEHMSQQNEEQYKDCICEEQQDRISMLESELSACKQEQNKKIDSLQSALLNMEKEYSKLQIENNKLKQENRYLKINSVNTNKYEWWTEQEILFWIISLNDGQFSRYKDILSKSLKDESVTGMDLNDVEPNDIKRWGITTFKDIKAFYKQIQRLTSNNQNIINHPISKEEI